ncbi:MAG: DUF3570 domain-containing protein [Helicobacteraceae bacterium]|nr:DUF3570 domain-containing protein [Helicobacteraceae bacterium]
MQVKRYFLAVCMLFVPWISTSASNLKDSASMGLDTYSDNNDVQVFSPTLSLMKTVSKNFLVGMKMRIDAISAASIKNGGAPTRVDTVAGASARNGYDETRYAPTFLLAYDDGENAASAGVYYSTENDYEGKAVFGSYVRQLNEENTALGIGISQSFDRWKPVFDRELPKDYRDEFKIDLSINQLLSPTSSLQFVYSYMNSKGFLSSPYHYVLQSDFAKFENYPAQRTGHAFALKGVTLLNNENSMNYSYRYYVDDWDITSHTLNLEWLHDFSSKIMSGLRLRYYTQEGASFAKRVGTYTLEDTYFAADYRMSAFDSFDVGIPLVYKQSVVSSFKYSMSIDYYQTSNNDYIQNWFDRPNLKAFYTTFRIDYEF